MTEFELLVFLRTANEGVDMNFQFWLSSTFAIILAFFFAGEKIIGYIRRVAILLYAVSTIIFTFRIAESGRMASQARKALKEIDSDFLIISSDAALIAIGGSFMTIILLGTVVTVYFCLFSKKIMGK